MSLTVDESLRFADQQYTKQSFAGVLTAEVRRLSAENERLRAELAQERKRLDWAMRHDTFYDHATHVFHCDPAFKIVNPQVRIETDNPRATIDELMGDTP